MSEEFCATIKLSRCDAKIVTSLFAYTRLLADRANIGVYENVKLEQFKSPDIRNGIFMQYEFVKRREIHIVLL
jgi:hypothetical protein